MKLKHFEKFQHYYLDKIAENVREGKDVAAALLTILDLHEGEIDHESAIQLIHDRLKEHPAKDPAHGQWRTWGFVPPHHAMPEDLYVGMVDGERQYVQALAVEIHECNALVLCVEKRERVLPASSINDKLFERAAEMKAREERELNRKDYAILKDEVTAQLLTTAPIRRSRIYVMIDGLDLYVFTGSQKAAEETTSLIRVAFSSLPTVPAYGNEEGMRRFFRSILLREESVSDKFFLGSHLKLVNDEKETISVKDGELAEPRYRDLLASGFIPTEMEFRYFCTLPGMENIWAKMNHKGDVKAFSTSAECDDAEFEVEYDRGGNAFQLWMTELWVMRKAVGAFSRAMYTTGVMVNRTEVGEYEDGDEAQVAKEAKAKAKGGDAVPESEEDMVDDEWDLGEEEDEESDDDI